MNVLYSVFLVVSVEELRSDTLLIEPKGTIFMPENSFGTKISLQISNEIYFTFTLNGQIVDKSVYPSWLVVSHVSSPSKNPVPN